MPPVRTKDGLTVVPVKALAKGRDVEIWANRLEASHGGLDGCRNFAGLHSAVHPDQYCSDHVYDAEYQKDVHVPVDARIAFASVCSIN